MALLPCREIVDCERYPLDRQDSAGLERIVGTVRESLAADGCAVLPGFLSDAGLFRQRVAVYPKHSLRVVGTGYRAVATPDAEQPRWGIRTRGYTGRLVVSETRPGQIIGPPWSGKVLRDELAAVNQKDVSDEHRMLISSTAEARHPQAVADREDFRTEAGAIELRRCLGLANPDDGFAVLIGCLERQNRVWVLPVDRRQCSRDLDDVASVKVHVGRMMGAGGHGYGAGSNQE